MKDIGKRLAETRNEVINEIFAVLSEDLFSFPYALKATVRRRREMDMIPVKSWARKEKKEKVTIQYAVLESFEDKCFNMKYNEKKKKMNPKLLGTEIAPK
jgi:hypothetical protein